jgi:hypothetical protein
MGYVLTGLCSFIAGAVCCRLYLQSVIAATKEEITSLKQFAASEFRRKL